MTQQTVTILGGSGMLGTDVARECRRGGLSVDAFDLPEFDITDPEQLKKIVRPASRIVNCAAYTNVDGAESESELAYSVNAEAVGRLGTLAKQAGVLVLHISTDFVFDGTLDRPYKETDEPNPINEYGRTKLLGERLLAQSGCRYCIIRVEWTYGKAGNNFVKKLIERAKESKSINVVADQIGSPTATTEAASTICDLLAVEPEGLFHFASAGYVSRYQMAEFIVERAKLDVKVCPCKTSDYPSPAARPLNSRFDCSKIQALLADPIKGWEEPLERFLRQL